MHSIAFQRGPVREHVIKGSVFYLSPFEMTQTVSLFHFISNLYLTRWSHWDHTSLFQGRPAANRFHMKHKTIKDIIHYIYRIHLHSYRHVQVPIVSTSMSFSLALQHAEEWDCSVSILAEDCSKQVELHIKAVSPKTVLALGSSNKTTSCDLRQ